MKTKVLTLCAGAILTLALTGAAQGSMLTFTLNEDGGNVVGTVSGTLNTNALAQHVLNYTDDGMISSDWGILAVGSGHALWRYSGFTSDVSSFGTGFFCEASTGTGDTVAVNFSQKDLYLPNDYVSGSELSGNSTWNNTNLANLRVVAGTYTMTYNGGVDSVVLQVNTVPEPGSLALLGAGVLLALICRRRGA